MTKNIKFVSYHNKETFISIKVPEDWEGQQINETQFRLFGTYHQELDYRSTMSYMKIKAKNYNKQLMRKQMNNSLKEMFDDYNHFLLINQKEDFIDEMPIIKREFEWQDINTGLHFSQTQTFILYKPSICYLVNTATLFKLKETYNPIFEQIIKFTRIVE